MSRRGLARFCGVLLAPVLALGVMPAAGAAAPGCHGLPATIVGSTGPDTIEGTAGGVSLADWLRARGVDEVDIVGIATDYCVRETAADAMRAGFKTRVLVDLTAGVGPDSTEQALDEMREHGVELVHTA